MSLLLRNKLIITFNPQQINMTWHRNSWRGVKLQQLTFPCGPISSTAWTEPLAILKDAIKQEKFRSSHVSVMLSNHFVRYMLVPWNDMLLRSNEQQPYLQHLFRETYGDMATDYQLRISPAPPGKSRIASAIDNTLMEQLRTTITDAGLRLNSIQPWLMYRFNKQRQQLSREGGWFVTVEQGVIGITGIAHGEWQRVQMLRYQHYWQHELHTTLERIYLSGDADNIAKRLYWSSAEAHQEAPSFNNEWQVIQLDTKNSDSEKQPAAQLAAAN